MADEGREGRVPVVAVVGRPNVGKSSLVNRILGRREAIVEATPGVTRDRRSFHAEWAGRSFEVVDTGGLEPGAEGLDARVVEQAQVAIHTADVIVLVVDAVAGPLEDDLLVAAELRRTEKPVLVAANKVDDPRDEPAASTFYRLGLGAPSPVSALHGRGSGDFLQALVARLPDEEATPGSEWAAAAIVGRPNVGKSSILNALLGEARSIVHDVPGTTRDPVDSLLEVGEERQLRIVDTAGMRRQVQLKDPLEYYSWLRSRQTLERVDLAILVIDASEGVTGHDQRIAEDVVSSGRACIVVLNKWDLVTKDEIDRGRLEDSIQDKLRFLDWALFVRTSAATKRGINRLMPGVIEAIASHRRRLATSTVNQLVRDAQERRPHPRLGGRATRILYGVQANVAPPTFILFSTRRLEVAYLRYIEHRIRELEPFAGTPLRVQARLRDRPQRKDQRPRT
ncbi:MAG: ribosome biogenesis GTPase Der [Actinomycetota bacterium]|nr:ribosome biogenesis GTPase Der [Actinomycetota bacterium]